MHNLLFLVVSLVSVVQVPPAFSHGRLMNPPARNAMWRFGYPNPVNYNDHELFCGGYSVQQIENHGKCGVCGDNYASPEPRPHELGGLFGNAIIVRTYYSEQSIRVQVELTSNHQGHFEFRLCPTDNSSSEVTQECLDRYPIKIINPDGSFSTKYKIMTHERKASFEIGVKLPRGVTCERCVMQWKYTTGNSWGICEDGTEQMGCGPQENFVNCADIKILPNDFERMWVNPKFTSSSRSNPHMMYYRDYSKPEAPLTPLIISQQVCVATRLYSETPGMDDWCQSSCLRYPPYCPPNMCRCVEDCEAVGDFRNQMGSDQWCLDHCSVYPPRNCTAQRCSCI